MIRENCPYKVIKSLKYEIGRIIVYQDTFLINEEECIYTYTVNRDSVCVLPIYKNNVVAIEQYRYTLDRWLLELPAGAIDECETGEQAAMRELAEETGFIADELIYLGEYFMNQGISSAKCKMYYANCINKGDTNYDKTEFIKTKLIPINEFDKMIDNNEFNLLIGLAGWNLAKKKKLIR